MHPQSPLAAFTGVPSRGWDGEQGPYFAKAPNGAWGVSFVDIWRSDYVSNAMRGLMRFDLLRKIARLEMERRMQALQDAVFAVENKAVKDAAGWLVAFRGTDNLGSIRAASVLPSGHPQLKALETLLSGIGARKGYLFAFAALGTPIESADPKRLFIAANQVDVVVVDNSGAHKMPRV